MSDRQPTKVQEIVEAEILQLNLNPDGSTTSLIRGRLADGRVVEFEQHMAPGWAFGMVD